MSSSDDPLLPRLPTAMPTPRTASSATTPPMISGRFDDPVSSVLVPPLADADPLGVSSLTGFTFSYDQVPYWNRSDPVSAGCGTKPVNRSER